MVLKKISWLICGCIVKSYLYLILFYFLFYYKCIFYQLLGYSMEQVPEATLLVVVYNF